MAVFVNSAGLQTVLTSNPPYDTKHVFVDLSKWFYRYSLVSIWPNRAELVSWIVHDIYNTNEVLFILLDQLFVSSKNIMNLVL